MMEQGEAGRIRTARVEWTDSDGARATQIGEGRNASHTLAILQGPFRHRFAELSLYGQHRCTSGPAGCNWTRCNGNAMVGEHLCATVTRKLCCCLHSADANRDWGLQEAGPGFKGGVLRVKKPGAVARQAVPPDRMGPPMRKGKGAPRKGGGKGKGKGKGKSNSKNKGKGRR